MFWADLSLFLGADFFGRKVAYIWAENMPLILYILRNEITRFRRGQRWHQSERQLHIEQRLQISRQRKKKRKAGSVLRSFEMPPSNVLYTNNKCFTIHNAIHCCYYDYVSTIISDLFLLFFYNFH